MTRTLTAAQTEAAHDAAESVRNNAVDTCGNDFGDVEHVLNNRDEVLCSYYENAGWDCQSEAFDDAIWAVVVAFINN